MSHKALNMYIDTLIHRRNRAFTTAPPHLVADTIYYYEETINTLIDQLVDL